MANNMGIDATSPATVGSSPVAKRERVVNALAVSGPVLASLEQAQRELAAAESRAAKAGWTTGVVSGGLTPRQQVSLARESVEGKSKLWARARTELITSVYEATGDAQLKAGLNQLHKLSAQSTSLAASNPPPDAFTPVNQALSKVLASLEARARQLAPTITP